MLSHDDTIRTTRTTVATLDPPPAPASLPGRPQGDPFDNSEGFRFSEPEGTTRFGGGDSNFNHQLVAQAHIPPPVETADLSDFLPWQRCGLRRSRDLNRACVGVGGIQVVEPGDELLDEGQADPIIARRRGRHHCHPARDGFLGRDPSRQWGTEALGHAP